MKAYIITFFAYLFTYSAVEWLFKNTALSLALELAVVGSLLIYFRKSYPIKAKFDWLAIVSGALVFVLWVVIDLIPYPRIESTPYIPGNPLELILRLISMVLLAPIVEEFFTRFFLIRFAVSERWQKVKLGTFTWGSFIFTVLFFGFAHDMWLAGLTAGIIFNLLYYYRKNIESCVIAHMSSNIFLAVYILSTKTWYFW